MSDVPARNPIHERLALYRQYASVVEEQEEALESGDLDRFSELNITRRVIETEVESIQIGPSIAPDPEATKAIERALEMLRSVDARQKRLESKLRAMRQEVGSQIGGVSDRRGSLRSYLRAGAGPARIDVIR